VRRPAPGWPIAAAALGVLAVACASGAGVGNAQPRQRASSANPVPTPAVDGSGTGHRSTKAASSGAVRISAVGDTMLGNTPQLPPDPRHYLANVDSAVRGDAQIVFANLEGTLTTSDAGKCGRGPDDCFEFRDPPRYARYLAADGLTVLNDANNHSHDFGQAGLDQTVHAIHKAGMKQTGLPGEITVVHAGAVRVAFVAFAPYPNTADLLRLHSAAALVRRARGEAPVVVVYMHAGAEGSDADHVTGHEEYFVGEDRGNPEKFAHMAVRNGASLVIASGPHVLRGMEFYRHRLIAYSLGNFANFHNFAGGGILSESGILHVALTSTGGFLSARLIAVRLDAAGRPDIGGDSVALVRRLSKEDFGSSSVRISRTGGIRPPAG
jgi:Bacterial capsule synthesis protein PGA_cap